MWKLKEIKDKFFNLNKNDIVKNLKEVGNSFVPAESEIKVYYKDLEKQKKEILKQIKLLNEQIEQYREIGAKDTMNWLIGYKDILNDQLKEIDNTELKFGEDK